MRSMRFAVPVTGIAVTAAVAGVVCGGLAVAVVGVTATAAAAASGGPGATSGSAASLQSPASLATAGRTLLGASSVLADADRLVADRRRAMPEPAATTGRLLAADDGRLRDEVDAFETAVAPAGAPAARGSGPHRRAVAPAGQDDSAVRADIAALAGDVGRAGQVTGRTQAVVLESLDGADDSLSDDVDALVGAGTASP